MADDAPATPPPSSETREPMSSPPDVENPNPVESKTDDAAVDGNESSMLDQMGIKGLMTEISKHMGANLPAVQIEFEDLSLSVEIPVNDETIPTMATSFSNLGFHKKQTRTVNVLRKCSGVMSPGTMTLILSPPGAGKSSLMKALSGRIRPEKLGGQVWYSGSKLRNTQVRRLVGMVTQEDRHLPTLTVRETFDFSLSLLTDFETLPDDFMRKALSEKAENVIKLFGLSNCADTIVGDDLLRGVSGGERKRVTLGEMIMGNARALFADEISTGLDSATTFEIMKLLQMATRKFNQTSVVSLLQPPPEVYRLFDRILLMREGAIVYHGPRRLVKTYFQEMGLVCPDDMDEADWIVDFLTDPQLAWDRQVELERQARKDPEWTPSVKPPLTTDELVLYLEASLHRGQWGMLTPIYANTFTGAATSGGAAATESKSTPAMPVPVFGDFCHPLDTACISGPAEKLSLHTPWLQKMYGDKYSRSYFYQLKLVLSRAGKLMARNKEFIGSHIFQDVFMGLVIGSLFYQIKPEEFQLRYGVIFFSLLYLTFANMAEVPLSVTHRSIMYKQADSLFFSAPIYVVSTMLPSIPLAIADTVIFGSISYWMTGFDPDIGRFLFFLVAIFSSGLAFGQVFRNVAWAMPSLPVAQSMSGPAVAIFMLFAGFLITKGQIADWLVWLYWLSPLSWMMRSLAQNEFQASRYDTIDTATGLRTGDLYLQLYEIQTEDGWKWGGVIYCLCFTVVMLIGGVLALTHLRYSSVRSQPIDDHTNPTAPSLRGNLAAAAAGDDDDDAAAAAAAAAAPGAGAGAGDAEGKSTPGGEDAATDGAAPTAIPVKTSLPVQPVTLAIKNLKYTVDTPKGPKVLLAGNSAFFRPGQLCALMGSSGAGKTTLMDVIAGRKTGGKIEGQILVNGTPKDDEAFSRIMGYVEQNDLLSPYSTVREALTFSARMRLRTKLDDAALRAYVSETLTMLELDHVADFLIGDSESGLPTGTRKRVTVGLELVANPSVLFLDEPTSGLDSRSAAVLMRVIERIAHSGRTVVATIHQPSSSIFFSFQRLLLLRRGGATVYFGSIENRARPLIEHLESLAPEKPLPRNVNPANWMLDVISPKDADAADFAALYEASDLAKANTPKVDAAAQETNDVDMQAIADLPVYATSLVQQFKTVFHRTAATYWRATSYNFSRLMVLTGLGVMFGILYYDAGKKLTTLGGVQSLLASLLITPLFASVINMTTSINPIMSTRSVYYREQASRAYGPLTYALSLGILEVPYTMLMTVPFSTIFYVLADLKGDFESWLNFTLGVALLSLAFNAFGHFLAAATPNEQVAGIFGGLFISLMNLFSGFFAPQPDIPVGWLWLYWANPLSHTLRGIVMTQFHCTGSDCPTIQVPGSLTPVSVSDYMEDYTGHEFGDRWWYILATFGFAIVYRVFAILALRFINHLKR